jgi:putative PIN family toxin of toxin-antitoxin system
MPERPRIVVDTNVLVSRLLVPRSVPAEAVRRAVDRGTLLASDDTMAELTRVLARSKFDAYVPVEERQRFLRLLGRIVEMVPLLHRVQACRDPKDDKFLEVAVNGGADVIVSGDPDLTDMGSFRGIPILTPAAYLATDEQFSRQC